MAGGTPLRVPGLQRRLAVAGALAATALVGFAAGGPVARADSTGATSAPAATPSASGSYAPVGTPIKGGEDAASSTALGRPGQYTDTLQSGSKDTGTDGSVRYYSITLHKGDKAFFTATVVPPAKFADSGSMSLDVDITSIDESLCYFQDSNYESEQGNTLGPLSVVLATGEVGGPGWRTSCPSSGTFVVKVTRSGDAFQNDPMPLELGLHFEPKVVTSGVPGIAPSGSDVPISAGTNQLRQVDAGFSYDDAPVLGSGRYQDTISSGETRFVRVPLDWGQRLSFFVASRQVSANGGNGVTATASMYSPIRAPLDLADGTGSDFESGFGGSDAQLSGTTKVLVRYANRESTDDGIAPYSIAGDYYFALTLGYADDGTSLTVPYTMQLTVLGAPEASPSYSYSPVTGGASSSGDSGSSATVWVLVAVVLVVLLVAVWLFLLRRRRPAHAGTGPRQSRPGHGGRTGSGRGSAPTTGIPAPAPRPSVPPGPGHPSGPFPQGPPPGGWPQQGPPPVPPPVPPAVPPQAGQPQRPPHGPPR